MSKRRRVLLLTQVLPYPPDSGPKVKTWNLVKWLSEHHEVTLASFIRGDQADEVRHLGEYCREVHTVRIVRRWYWDVWGLMTSIVRRVPFIIARDERSEMHLLIRQLTASNNFDIIHADQLNMAQYAEAIEGPAKVLDTHNALWLLYQRMWQVLDPGPAKWVFARDWKLLKDYEGRICRDFDAVSAVSQEDRRALKEAGGDDLDVDVIPISIDPMEVQPVQRPPNPTHVLHIGTMFWPPNSEGVLWFLQEIWPLILKKRMDVELDIVGANPPQAIRSYDDDNHNVNVTDYVPDPAPYIARAACLVVPIRAGGGMRVKILNALAQGIPIVSTTIGCEGIQVEDGRHILIADQPDQFAEAVVALLDDRSMATQLGTMGRELIADRYNYRQVCRQLDTVYEKACLRRQS